MHAKHTSNGLLLGVAWSAIAPGLLMSATTLAANRVVTANSNMTFSPSTLTIAAGDTVTFRNGAGTHNVRSDPGSVTAFRCANGCDATGVTAT
jgi:plastocyanin